MTDKNNSAPEQTYEIVFQGHLDERWASWFDGMTSTRLPDGRTRLSGPVLDQSALHGMLSRIRDLGLPLLLLRRGDYQWTETELKGFMSELKKEKTNE